MCTRIFLCEFIHLLVNLFDDIGPLFTELVMVYDFLFQLLIFQL